MTVCVDNMEAGFGRMKKYMPTPAEYEPAWIWVWRLFYPWFFAKV
jgi:hypothetical protein